MQQFPTNYATVSNQASLVGSVSVLYPLDKYRVTAVLHALQVRKGTLAKSSFIYMVEPVTKEEYGECCGRSPTVRWGCDDPSNSLRYRWSVQGVSSKLPIIMEC
jgi:hypothetical protein